MCFDSYKLLKPGRLILITTIICSAFLQGCSTGVPVKNQQQTTSATAPVRIETLIKGLAPEAAIAALLEAASKLPGHQAFTLRQQAITLSIAHEPSDIAEQRLEEIKNLHPEPAYDVQLTLLRQRLLLSRNHPQAILGYLDQLHARASPSEQLQIMDLKADALQQAGFPVDSVQLRIELDRAYINQPEQRQENDLRLWYSLSQIPPDLIDSYTSEIPDTLSGWLELAYLSRQHQYSTTGLDQAIKQWQTRYTSHPASRSVINIIKQRQIETSRHPPHIALALPLSGKLAAIGQAVRDGFIGNYLLAGLQLQIDIYDTASNRELARIAIEQAQRSGAKFIVGPLHKAAVQGALDAVRFEPVFDASGNQLNQPDTNQAPLLVLNQPDTDAMENITVPVYHFALTPEGEARQAAERARMDGHHHAMIIVPQSIWGNRLYEAFATRYRELGGKIITGYRFQRDSSDYSEGIQGGIGLDRSKLRHRQIKQLLDRNIKFTPRVRKDIDMIFLAASSKNARQIKPQLKFFYAGKIPVYATSHIFTGNADPERDKDLNDTLFTDMPWVLDHKPAPGSLKKLINDHWPQESTRYGRFYALGADAFLLLPQLEWLNKHPRERINGYTGQLSLRQNTVSRVSSWARFDSGIPTSGLPSIN